MDTSLPLITIGYVRRLTGVSESHLRRHDAALRPVRDSIGRRLYLESVVREWLAARASKLAKIDREVAP